MILGIKTAKKGGEILKLKYIFCIARFITVSIIPALIIFAVGKKMQEDESGVNNFKRYEAEKTNN